MARYAIGDVQGCCDELKALLDRCHYSADRDELWSVPIGEDGHEEPGECNWVHAVALDSLGNLYAGDINGKRLQKFVRQPPAPGD